MRITRRKFLAGGCAVALSSRATQLGLPASSGYRAVIRIDLAGGNDAFNMVVPVSPTQYHFYRRWRGALALERASLLPLEGVYGMQSLALHPALTAVHRLFMQGSVAVLAGVGTLLEAYDGRAVAAGRARLPNGLFAHRAQASYWNGPVGACAAGPSDDVGLAAAMGEAGFDARCTQMIVEPLRAVTQPVLDRGARRIGSGHRTDRDMQHPLVHALDKVARLIACRRSDPNARDLIQVRHEGWDHHGDALAAHARALRSLDAGLLGLHGTLSREGAQDEVVVVTSSEFGRALAPNGSGSDHGWSGHHFVMGGPVRGGRIYGHYPDLTPDGVLHVGRGVFAPTMPVDFVRAELAGWVGLPIRIMPELFPYRGEFNSGHASVTQGDRVEQRGRFLFNS